VLARLQQSQGATDQKPVNQQEGPKYKPLRVPGLSEEGGTGCFGIATSDLDEKSHFGLA